MSLRPGPGVKLIRFEYCDVSGVARTKAIHIEQLQHKLLEGVALTRAQMSINLLDKMVHVDGMEPVGEIRLVPDAATFSVLPWAHEHAKPSDGSANPYLSLGALITAGLDGVEREREPGDAREHDPARLSAADLARSKILPLPTTMAAALDELEKDETLLSSMGDLLTRCYLAVRRSEEETFSSEDEAFEIRNHFYRF